MNENASIVLATTYMAGNGVVLLKAYDIVNNQPEPLQSPWLLVVLLILPPAVGLVSGWVMLSRVETQNYKPDSGVDRWLGQICMLGIGIPFGLWVMCLLSLFQ